MIVLFLVVLWLYLFSREAIRGYSAEKYAKKKVYGLDTPFIIYMFDNHPILFVIMIILIIAIIVTLIQRL